MAERPYLTPIGSADVTPSFSGLRTITRRFSVSGRAATAATVESACFRAYGTADDEFTAALLVEKRLDTASSDKNATEKILTEVYREFEDGEKVQVGDDIITRDKNNRLTMVRRSVAMATQAEGLANEAGDEVGVYGCTGSQVAKNGVGAIITETYLERGEISRTIQTTENGEERLVITSFMTEPATPTGYALEIPRVDDATSAAPTYTYTFAEATATATQIGKDVRETLRTGQKRLVRTLIQTSATTFAGTAHGTEITVSSVAFVLSEETAPCVNGVRFITQTYLQKGEIARSVKTYANGFVVTRVTTFADGAVPTVSGGTLALTQNDEAASPSATPTRVYTFVSGNGVFSTSIQTRTDGLRAVTIVSMGVKNVPSGEVVADVESEDDGMKRWSVTAMQAKDGSDVSGVSLEISRQEHFLMPGRVTTYTSTVGTNNILGIYVSPPQDIEVEATVTITYANTKGDAPDIWAMTEGCTMVAKFQAVPYGVGVLKTEYYPDCRAVGTGDSITASGLVGDGTSSLLGYRLYGSTTATITLTGGPGDPAGDQTLAWSSEPAFTTTTGTVWYRRVTVTATIPSQPSLPSSI